MIDERASPAFRKGYFDRHAGKPREETLAGTFYAYDYNEGYDAAEAELYWAERRHAH